MKFKSIIGALVISAALANQSYAFEWLDNLLGIDLDNSDAAPDYGYYSTGYAPYNVGYAAPAYNGCANCAPAYANVPQASYRPVYQPMPVTSYRPATTYSYGTPVTTMRPAVSYPMPSQAAPYTVNQPVYAPATSYAPSGCNCGSGN